MIEMALATAATFAWAAAAAAVVMLPDAWAVAMAWVRTSATTEELSRPAAVEFKLNEA